MVAFHRLFEFLRFLSFFNDFIVKDFPLLIWISSGVEFFLNVNSDGFGITVISSQCKICFEKSISSGNLRGRALIITWHNCAIFLPKMAKSWNQREHKISHTCFFPPHFCVTSFLNPCCLLWSPRKFTQNPALTLKTIKRYYIKWKLI